MRDTEFLPIKKMTVGILAVLLLAACTVSKPPGDFETGEETTPPLGCIEYRTRGGDC